MERCVVTETFNGDMCCYVRRHLIERCVVIEHLKEECLVTGAFKAGVYC